MHNDEMLFPACYEKKKEEFKIELLFLVLSDPHGVGGNTIWDQDGCVEW